MKTCIACGTELSGGLDTYGEIGQELCLSCWFGFQNDEGFRDEEADQMIYGHPPPGLAPEDFTPDYELCTREEIHRWQVDLLTHTPHQSDTGWLGSGDTQVHVLSTTWGVGIYRIR